MRSETQGWIASDCQSVQSVCERERPKHLREKATTPPPASPPHTNMRTQIEKGFVGSMPEWVIEAVIVDLMLLGEQEFCKLGLDTDNLACGAGGGGTRNVVPRTR